MAPKVDTAGRAAKDRAKTAGKGPAKPASKTAGGATPVRAGRRTPQRITPEQALDNTRALLEAKHARDREAPPWQTLGSDTGTVPAPHFQSDDARVQANALHQGEMDLDAIQGTISSNDRHTQGKRDSR